MEGGARFGAGVRARWSVVDVWAPGARDRVGSGRVRSLARGAIFGVVGAERSVPRVVSTRPLHPSVEVTEEPSSIRPDPLLDPCVY